MQKVPPPGAAPEKSEAVKQAELVEGRANVLVTATLAFAEAHPHQAIALLTELLITVTEQLIAASGADPKEGIYLQGPNRGITIHAKKEIEAVMKA